MTTDSLTPEQLTAITGIPPVGDTWTIECVDCPAGFCGETKEEITAVWNARHCYGCIEARVMPGQSLPTDKTLLDVPDFLRNQTNLTAERKAIIKALRSQRQLDRDGVEVWVSRQACDEAADILERIIQPPTARQKCFKCHGERPEGSAFALCDECDREYTQVPRLRWRPE
jgi:hypothetical protein